MALRSRLESVPETVQELEAAAEEMYQTGKFLVRGKQRYHNSGIYLLGYAAEIWLKTAYFRSNGAVVTDNTEPRLAPARTKGQNLTPPVDHESYHSLRLWARLIEDERRIQGKRLPPVLARELQTRTDRLYSGWWIAMRYRQALAMRVEAKTFLQDVEWLRHNHTALWS